MSRQLFVLELYPFGYGMGRAFENRGHVVFTVDFQRRKKHGANAIVTTTSIPMWEPPTPPSGRWDLVLLRPFCPTYSRGAFYMHYRSHKTGVPVDGARGDKAREADRLVLDELDLARRVNPRLGWLLENPNGDLRKCPFMAGLPVATVTLCQYGDVVRKATDLFGTMPPEFTAKACKAGSDCHQHSNWKAKSGSVYGDALKRTKGSSWNKAALPHDLSWAIAQAFEAADDRGWTAPQLLKAEMLVPPPSKPGPVLA